MINAPAFDLAAINAITPIVLAQGDRILQTHKYAATDKAHVDLLLQWLDPAHDSIVVDMGCGIGEVAKLMRARRPDLQFILVNLSDVQLAQCPVGDGYASVLADAHATGLDAGLADAVMFHSALANMDAGPALMEAARLLRPGGTVMLNEMTRRYGNNARFDALLGARALTIADLTRSAQQAGLDVISCDFPAYDDSRFRLRLGPDADILDPIIPAIIKMRKK